MRKSTIEIKLCKDCKWHSCSKGLNVCNYHHNINIVTGKVMPLHCGICRDSLGPCKVQAIHFEEKTTLAVIVKRMYNNICSYLNLSKITIK